MHRYITLLWHVLDFQAPVSFFDVTPVGRILNRFSSDVFSVDDTLPFILNIFLAQSFSLLGVVVVCCYGLPYIILLIIPLTVIYYFIQVTYLLVVVVVTFMVCDSAQISCDSPFIYGGMLAWLSVWVRCRFAYAQLIPQPLTVSCCGKSRLVLPFWYRLTWVVPDTIQEAVKWL